MKFNLINEFKSEGFSGFVTIDELMKNNCSQIPTKKGIYIVIRKSNKKPTFMIESVGGHFKGKNPTVDISKLESQWAKLNLFAVLISQEQTIIYKLKRRGRCCKQKKSSIKIKSHLTSKFA